MYPLSPNSVPPSVETNRGSRRYRDVRPYVSGAAGALLVGELTHTTNTHAGSLQEHVSFAPHAGAAGVDPSWLNYAERDAFRAMAEAHFLLPPSQAVRIHIPWTENDC
jgi:hypothetical protein